MPVTSASQLVGTHLLKGSIVVFESTVYPGVTEEICVPILEKESGLICGKDFMVGYSPERINPGDKVHRLENIIKIVSGINKESLQEIALVYAAIIKVGVYSAPSIKVAEAAKLVENAQRDINIAFMNELAMVFDRMEISTKEVCDAMGTKWNALNFTPGLVGGHCIGVDPWYFVYKAENLGYHTQIISLGRKINDDMGIFVADAIIKNMIQAGINVCNAKIYLMGIAFKEDCPDVRNSRSFDVLKRFAEYHIQAHFIDPVVDKAELKRTENIDVLDLENVKDADCLAFLVGHKEFKDLSLETLQGMYKPGANVLIDVKSIFNAEQLRAAGYTYWSL
jgi:UDP-N-acetyl-D-galactosamine dehydrogenase